MNDEMPKVTDISAAIEAILYAAGHPVTYEKLSEVLGLDIKSIKKMVSAMSREYESDKRGIMLLTYPDSCQLATKEQYMPYIREALGIKRGGNLSASTLEALAVVAYNQPVTRAYVDAVRGVDSSYAMNSLIDKNLIVSTGRLDAPGRPMLYSTTDKFLRVFGLRSLDELPVTEFSAMAGQSSEQLTAEEAAENQENTDTEPKASTEENR